MKQFTCIHCKESFSEEKKIKKPDIFYCPYCRAVILGKTDDAWLPTICVKPKIKPFIRKF